MGFTSESIFFVCSILAARPHPPRFFLEGGACPALLEGGGTPPSRHRSMAGTPLQGTQRGTPSRFPARVYVGDYTQVIAQKGDREGGPPWYQRSKYPTPLSFQWEGGPPLGRTGGGHLIRGRWGEGNRTHGTCTRSLIRARMQNSIRRFQRQRARQYRRCRKDRVSPCRHRTCRNSRRSRRRYRKIVLRLR